MPSVSVEIMGQHLEVASDADADWVRAVARAVDARAQDIRTRARSINTVDLAILTALNFADELERLRLEYRELLEQIDALNKRLSESFEGNE
ncbi:MAG TPA: cell division protein ZapA [Candidatus Binataceae bacterium]|nr:cell division protein ZapA [Candidatus Binataceae bacterium]